MSLYSLISPRPKFERAEDAAGDPDRIGDIAEHELLRRVAGIEQAEQVLTVAAGRERAELRSVGAARDAGAHRQELDVALHAAQLAGDAGDGERVVLLRFVRHAPIDSTRPRPIASVTSVTSPPNRLCSPAPMPPMNPIDCTLLPITISPGLKPLSPRQ